jgi:hypothetical protein
VKNGKMAAGGLAPMGWWWRRDRGWDRGWYRGKEGAGCELGLPQALVHQTEGDAIDGLPVLNHHIESVLQSIEIFY